MTGALVVIGDALLDRDVLGEVGRLAPDAPVPVLDELNEVHRPGGAGLAALLAARDGREVTLITAIADDEPGHVLRSALADAGIEIVDLGLAGVTPEKIRFRTGGRSLLRLDRGVRSGLAGRAPASARAAIGWAAGVLVSDYGRGVAAEPDLRAALAALPPQHPVVWDPHPRGPAPAPGVTVVTPNEAEVRAAVPEPGGSGLGEASERAARLRSRWEALALCMTRGCDGALLLEGDSPALAIPAPRRVVGDPCGAGDRFASRLAGVLADGGSVSDAAVAAVACATAFVEAGGPASTRTLAPEPRGDDDAVSVADRVRASGRTLVATGGCFDLLHAGHVRTLEAARRLGDALVVCLNSDASVRRLKGSGRPLVSAEERAAILAALGCVDAVLVFDEDTPVRALERVRPHVWAKGGDYDGAELPEDAVVRSWGGHVVILPYVEGHSTTRLIEEAASRG